MLKSLLDAMRLIADSKQQNFAHITVKGPYKTSQKKRLTIDNQEIAGTHLKVTGAGNFFQENQNTVFLKCEENLSLYNIWKKKEEKTYKEFHPHITIYDGKDREFASSLFNVISSYKINFQFEIDKLDLYSSKEKGKLFNLKTQANYNLLSTLSGFRIDESNVESLSKEQRIEIIHLLCRDLEVIVNDRGLIITKELKTNKKQSILIEA